MDAPWTKSAEQLLEHFSVDPARGLSSGQADKHAEIYGRNGTTTLLTVHNQILIFFLIFFFALRTT